MKLGIGYIKCINCGIHIFPPKDVSDVGIEIYEEKYDVPLINPREEWIPDIDKINDERRQAGLKPYKSIDEWIADYKNWAISFRNDVKSKANNRLAELNEKIKDAQIIEKDETIKIVGKRYEAVLEIFDNSWKLKCPNCDYVLAKCEW
jgi:hypothetical protein